MKRAEAHIASGERRLAAQELLIERMRAAQIDTTNAEQMAAALRQALADWYEHRQQIVDALAKGE